MQTKNKPNKQKKAIGARFRMYLDFECSMFIQKEMNLMGQKLNLNN